MGEDFLGQRLAPGTARVVVRSHLGVGEHQGPHTAGVLSQKGERDVPAQGNTAYHRRADAEVVEQQKGVLGQLLHGCRPFSQRALSEAAQIRDDEARLGGEASHLRVKQGAGEGESMQQKHRHTRSGVLEMKPNASRGEETHDVQPPPFLDPGQASLAS